MFEAIIVIARLVQFSGALVLFGASVFFLYGLRMDGPLEEGMPGRWPRHLLNVASATALVASIGWFMFETAALTGNPQDAIHGAALWSLFTDTQIGKFAVLRIGLLAVSIIVLRSLPGGKRLWILQGALSAAAVASFAWSGHGAMNDGVAGLVHLGTDVLHLLAAGMWIGALVPLAILLMRGAHTSAAATRLVAQALDRFSGVGPAVVAILILTGIINSLFMVDLARWRSLLISPYVLTLLSKLALFAGMLLLAAANRFRLAPALTEALSNTSSMLGPVRRMRASILTETVLAIMVIAAVALLGTLEPPTPAD